MLGNPLRCTVVLSANAVQSATLPKAGTDALLPAFLNFLQKSLDDVEIQVGEAFESDTSLAAAHFSQLCEVDLYEVTFANIECHVILLRGQGAKLAERWQTIFHGFHRFWGHLVDDGSQLAQGSPAVRRKLLQVIV